MGYYNNKEGTANNKYCFFPLRQNCTRGRTEQYVLNVFLPRSSSPFGSSSPPFSQQNKNHNKGAGVNSDAVSPTADSIFNFYRKQNVSLSYASPCYEMITLNIYCILGLMVFGCYSIRGCYNTHLSLLFQRELKSSMCTTFDLSQGALIYTLS